MVKKRTKLLIAGALGATAYTLYVRNQNSSPTTSKQRAPSKSSTDDWPEDSMASGGANETPKPVKNNTAGPNVNQIEHLKGQNISAAIKLLGEPTKIDNATASFFSTSYEEDQFLMAGNRTQDLEYYHWDLKEKGFIRIYASIPKERAIVAIFHKVAPTSRL
jgi:hypothetical protein